ncbi:MAG: rhomboid family intramembrane serine protease [Desulfuromonadales bacterium]|nr:rhomboid family intramembrane serine protease [Desulfuromonadales bacterium]
MPERPPPDHPFIPESTDSNDPLTEIRLNRFFTDLASVNQKTLKNLTLVLTARGIPCWPQPINKPQQLLVKNSDLEIAEREISLYLQENRKQPPPPPERFGHRESNIRQTVSILLLIGIFHNITYLDIFAFGHAPINWLQLGRADADLIRAGEWWRTITALTLHADAQHLLGNLLIGGYFVIRLCRLLGGGLGWTLILWSGVFGNTINALIHTSGHRSIGASTALFGAIGAAGMIGLMRQRQVNPRYTLLPVAAAIGLLAMLGAGGADADADAVTDIGAHLFGFFCGLALGAGAAWSILKYGLPSPPVNKVLATVALLTPVAAWILALTN